MMADVLHATFVFAALALVLVAPPWCIARRLAPHHDAATIALTSLLLGAGSQALLGFAWDRSLLRAPAAAAAIYYGLWGLLTLVAGYRTAYPPREPPQITAALNKAFPLTGIILLAAVLVRSLHPLAHVALGQSDAYGHLQFLRQATQDGFLHNRIYPPGYAWVMALPVLTFRIDPYQIARYAGAFWGAGITLGMMVLAGNGNRRQGYLAGALVAICPLFLPLLKTGVGMFANQFGLFLVPVLLHSNLNLERRAAKGTLMLGAAALSAAVPMMFITLTPVLVLDRLTAWAVRVPGAKRMVTAALLVLLPAGALLMGQALAIRGNHRDATLSIVTNRAPDPTPSPQMEEREEARPTAAVFGTVRHLLRDILSVKRAGYGRPELNLAASVLAAAFLTALLFGLLRVHPGLRLLGLFGLVTSLQAGTGVLQFSAYQREGWSLLLAVAWLGAVLGDRLIECAPFGPRLPIRAVVAGFIFFLAVSVRYPPGHPGSFSRSEDDIVRITRAAAREVRANPARRPLTIIARSFTGFPGNQGDLLPAVIGPSERIQTLSVGPGVSLDGMPRDDREYLVLIDLEPLPEKNLPSVFSALQTVPSAHFMREHRRLLAFNQSIEDWLKRIPAERWTVEPVYRNDSLVAVRIRPGS